MRKILEDLYYGRVNMVERTIRRESELDKSFATVAQLDDALRKMLPPNDRSILDQYIMAYSEMADLSRLEDFIQGFQMGAQIMLSVLLPDEQMLLTIGSDNNDQEK